MFAANEELLRAAQAHDGGNPFERMRIAVERFQRDRVGAIALAGAVELCQMRPEVAQQLIALGVEVVEEFPAEVRQVGTHADAFEAARA